MKKLICLLMGAGLLAACEQKETTVNPPAKEENTTIINKDASPAEKKTEETKTETNINLNASPAPSP